MTNSDLVSAPADEPLPLAAAVVGAAMADIRNQIAQRVGLPGETPLPVILAALDEALSERADNAAPPGTKLVDEHTLADLERDARVGRETRHDRLVADAITKGKITPAARANWSLLLETDPGAEAALHKIKPNTAVPLSSLGYANEADERDELYGQVYGH